MRRLSLLLFLACAPSGPTYHSDIAPLLAARCTNCHVEGGIAPFSLTTYANAKQMGAAMVADVKAGLMPPWKAGPSDVTYLRDPQLTPDQLNLLSHWVDDGMPEGDASATPRPLEPIGGGIDRVDRTLTMDAPYTPTQFPDDYRCFPLRWPETDTTFITGFNAKPGVDAEVHHIALFLVPPDSADIPFQWDAEEDGPGYTCFGDPYGNHPMSFAAGVLNAWIPGYQGVAFPRGLGEQVLPGSTIVLQVHYNLSSITAQPDQTTLQFKLANHVERLAAYQPFLDVTWAAGAMDIPPGASNVLYQYVGDPRGFFKLFGSPLDNTKGFNIEAVMLHMHKLGKVGEVYLDKTDGSHVKLLSIPDWDFHWQMEYFLDQPVRFEPGDQMRLRCTFDNSPSRDPQMRDVNWGEGTDDEMCIANLLSSQVQ